MSKNLVVVTGKGRTQVLELGRRGPPGPGGGDKGDKGDKGDPGTPGAPGANSGTGANVSTRTGMAAIPAPADRAIALLTEADKPGAFTFDATAAVADVSADPDQMLFVAPTASPSGSAGIWRRDHNNIFDAEWALNRGSDTPADTRAKLQRAIRLAGRNKGATLLMPARDIDLDVGSGSDIGNISIDVPDITLVNRSGVWTRNGAPNNPANVNTFTVKRSNVRMEGFIFREFRTTGGSGQGVCIDVRQGNDNHQYIGDIRNVTLTDCKFYGCDNPLRIAGSLASNGSVVVPDNVLVEDMLIDDCAYQAVAVWLSENVRFLRPRVGMKDAPATGREQFHLPFRLIGCHDTLIEDAEVTGYKTQPIFGIMAGSGGQSPYNLHIRNAICRRAATLASVIGARGLIHIEGGRMDNAPAIGLRTQLLSGYVVEAGWTGEDVASSEVVIEGVRGSGLSHVANWNGPFKSIVIQDTDLTGSSYAVQTNTEMAAVAVGNQGGITFDRVEVYRNRWALQPRAAEAISVANVVSNNSTVCVWGNRFPFPSGDYLSSGAPRRDVALKIAGTGSGLRLYTAPEHAGHVGGNSTAFVSDMGNNGFVGQTTGASVGSGSGGETPSGGPSTTAGNWTSSQNTLMEPASNGFVKIAKAGGSNGSPDAFAKTTAAFAGDFTLIFRLTYGLGGEVLIGLNDTPSNSYLSLDRLIDVAAGGSPVGAYSTNFTFAASLPNVTTASYVIVQRVGTSIKVYKNETEPLVSSAGAALHEWAGDSTAYFGEVCLLNSTQTVDVKMTTP